MSTAPEIDTEALIAEGRQAIVDCGRAREAEEAALSRRDVAMRALYAGGVKPPEIARQLDVSPTLVRSIVVPPRGARAAL